MGIKGQLAAKKVTARQTKRMIDKDIKALLFSINY
jgi:hypothetical protein